LGRWRNTQANLQVTPQVLLATFSNGSRNTLHLLRFPRLVRQYQSATLLAQWRRSAMVPNIDVVDELLGLARDPEPFSKDDMAEIALVAATEIIKLRRYETQLGRSRGRRQSRDSRRQHGTA
jgi:hypothetical protein